jgi:hypothetical protein
MRFLALQTDVEEMKKGFLVEGEKELLTTAHHFLSFLAPFAFMTVVTIGMVAVVMALLLFSSEMLLLFLTILLTFWLLFYLYYLVKIYIDWRYNFVIVTTQKIVVIRHHTFLHQYISPVNLDNIASNRVESQWFGIFRCGIICLSLKERQAGSTKEIFLRYIPNHNVVASTIENAIALASQRTQGEKPIAQEHKVEDVKEKIEELNI